MRNSIGLSVALLGLTTGFVDTTNASEVIINEYNGVRHTEFLKDDLADSRFGKVRGNGGNWFELAVVGDDANPGAGVDMRGWSIEWEQANYGDAIGDDMDQSLSGSVQLSHNAAFSSVGRGTLVTFAENPNLTDDNDFIIARGSDTSVNYQQQNGDWWMHVWTGDSDLVTDGELFSDLWATNDDLQLRILDADGNVVQDWVGEGASHWNQGGVNSQEIMHLQADPASTDFTAFPDAASYEDSGWSTFGMPNGWGGDGTENVQNFDDLRSWAPVPEPASLSLLAIGGLGLLRRRRSR